MVIIVNDCAESACGQSSSDFYPSTFPAWVTLPDIALRVIEVRKPPPRDKDLTVWEMMPNPNHRSHAKLFFVFVTVTAGVGWEKKKVALKNVELYEREHIANVEGDGPSYDPC